MSRAAQLALCSSNSVTAFELPPTHAYSSAGICSWSTAVTSALWLSNSSIDATLPYNAAYMSDVRCVLSRVLTSVPRPRRWRMLLEWL